MKLEKDTIISHYKIRSAIGKDGMGEVNPAQDKCVRSLTVKEGFRNKNGTQRVSSLAAYADYPTMISGFCSCGHDDYGSPS